MKNAGFKNTAKSRTKAVRKLVKGKRFVYRGEVISFRPELLTQTYGTPFRMGQPSLSPLGAWLSMEDWCLPPTLEELLAKGKPQWCKIRDFTTPWKVKKVVLMNTYIKGVTYPYRDIIGQAHAKATKVSEKESKLLWETHRARFKGPNL